MIFHRFKGADGNEICDMRLTRCIRVRCDKVSYNGKRYVSSLWKPVQQRITRPFRHKDKAVDLRDYLTFILSDLTEHPPITRDLLHMHPLVRLRDSEVNRHDHPLMRTLPCAQGCASSERALGIDCAGTYRGKTPSQRIAKESLMPVPIPGDAGRPAAPL